MSLPVAHLTFTHSRSAGSRLGQYLDQVVPLLLTNAESLGGDDDDETRENILQVLSQHFALFTSDSS